MTITQDNYELENKIAHGLVDGYRKSYSEANSDDAGAGDAIKGKIDSKTGEIIQQLQSQPYSADVANNIIGVLAAREHLHGAPDGAVPFHLVQDSVNKARKDYFEHYDKRDAGTVTGDIMHQLGVDKMDAAIQKQVHDKLMVIAGKKDGLTELKEIDLNLQGARAGVKGARPVDEEAQDMRDHLDVAANGQYGHDFKDALKPVAGQHVNPADRLTLSVVKAVMSYAGSGNAVNPETGAATETYSVKDAGPDVKRDPSVPVINWADPAAGQPGGAPAQQPGQQQQQGQPGQNGQPGQPAPVAGGNGDGAAHFASGSGQLSDDDKKAMDAQIDAKIATLKAGDTLDFTIVVGHDATGSKRANLAAMKARQAAVEAEVQERLKASHKDVKVAAHVQQVDPEKGAKGEDAKMRFAKIQFGQP